MSQYYNNSGYPEDDQYHRYSQGHPQDQNRQNQNRYGSYGGGYDEYYQQDQYQNDQYNQYDPYSQYSGQYQNDHGYRYDQGQSRQPQQSGHASYQNYQNDGYGGIANHHEPHRGQGNDYHVEEDPIQDHQREQERQRERERRREQIRNAKQGARSLAKPEPGQTKDKAVDQPDHRQHLSYLEPKLTGSSNHHDEFLQSLSAAPARKAINQLSEESVQPREVVASRHTYAEKSALSDTHLSNQDIYPEQPTLPREQTIKPNNSTQRPNSIPHNDDDYLNVQLRDDDHQVENVADVHDHDRPPLPEKDYHEVPLSGTRVQQLAKEEPQSRQSSFRSKQSRRPLPINRNIDYNEAYMYALRVAYLHYLLQPREKRIRTIQNKPAIARATTTTSFHDLMKDFSKIKDTKSAKYPNDFVKELQKRLQNIIMGKEKSPEFNDPHLKPTFGAFLSDLSGPDFKKRMSDRRAEDLMLIFYATATKQLARGKPPTDETVKKTVDRHVALFVRLMGMVLKDRGWASERPDLALRLETLATKLMLHDQDLSNKAQPESSTSTSTTVEEIIPLSHEVKDMRMVQIVGRIFGIEPGSIQSDVNSNKSTWTEQAAVKDLKTYQARLSVGGRNTYNSSDFASQEAYEAWKKSDSSEISQMILSMVQINPSLAKGAPAEMVQPIAKGPNDAAYAEISKNLAQAENSASYVVDMPADMAGLDLDDHIDEEPKEHPYVYIPKEPRSMFRFILFLALTHDLSEQENGPPPSPLLLSRASIDLLHEIGIRWRVPKSSRLVLFLDVMAEKYVSQKAGVELLEVVFEYARSPPVEESKNKKGPVVLISALHDREMWTAKDLLLMRELLSAIHTSLFRDLYETITSAYDDKPTLSRLADLLPFMDNNIEGDPDFQGDSTKLEEFKGHVSKALEDRARTAYQATYDKEIPKEEEKVEFYHVQQLASKVLKFAEKMRKRFKKTPQILGIDPVMILFSFIFPAFGEDSKTMVNEIVANGEIEGQEVAIADAFQLYKDLCEFREKQREVFPQMEFPYKIEDCLSTFVWKWVRITEQQVAGWVDNAFKNDKFVVDNEEAEDIPGNGERHSDSVVDIFRSYNQTISELQNLSWQDEHDHAKFMTALSKPIAAGVSRYCELVDGLFTKEMDRLTPEQEAAATMTRQEKLLQYAKDTWNNQSRVEPFHFYPTSFVKLNNITYAIENWDKLDNLVGVDRCAEIVKHYNPPSTQKARQISNYVFTIKIVEAENLKACDVNGFSDPYVVLSDEYQKRLSKTKIVYRNLNPRWDETIDITTQGAINLIATVWDWDAIGDHDYVGRSSLKLDPIYFGDFLPHEFWIDLDTQGRVLLRVSMEGERDDIQFYFGKAFRSLQRTQKDMTRKITDKLSPYINHCLSLTTLRSLLKRGGITISSVSSYFGRNRNSVQPTAAAPTTAEIEQALDPLFTYFDDNFAIMNRTLTPTAMRAVMARIWKEILITVEGLLVPPLSDKPSQQRPLTQQELDIVFKWLQSLYSFFNAVDEETGIANGVPAEVLKNARYMELVSLNFFYTQSTDDLIRESLKIAKQALTRQQDHRSRFSAPPALGGGLGGSALAASTIRGSGMGRAKSIMVSRNLGTMKKAKQEKRQHAQAEQTDDMILRILRMRPEAGGFLKDRSRDKQKQATAAAAEAIVRQSLMAGGGRMTGPAIGGGPPGMARKAK